MSSPVGGGSLQPHGKYHLPLIDTAPSDDSDKGRDPLSLSPSSSEENLPDVEKLQEKVENDALLEKKLQDIIDKDGKEKIPIQKISLPEVDPQTLTRIDELKNIQDSFKNPKKGFTPTIGNGCVIS